MVIRSNGPSGLHQVLVGRYYKNDQHSSRLGWTNNINVLTIFQFLVMLATQGFECMSSWLNTIPVFWYVQHYLPQK